MRFVRRLLALLLTLALVAGAVWAFLPRPVPVETARVERGTLRVAVEAEGRTCLREPYRVSTPVAGRVRRIQLHAGDPVVAGETVLAVVEPTDATLLDPRAQAVAEASVRTAEAAEEAAKAAIARARVALAFEEGEVTRREPLVRKGIVTAAELAERTQRVDLAKAELRAAELQLRVAAFEHEQAEAALVYATPPKDGESRPKRHEVRAPIGGVVLRVLGEDEGVLPAGTALLEIGDLEDLEVEADFLTRDAVRLAPGQPARLAQWGGEPPLDARVRRVEPAAFTKVSALGVDEQRVWVKIEFVSPPAARPRLGQGYRVEVSVVVEEVPDAKLVPTGALFRRGEGWAAFVVRAGRATLVDVDAGRSDGRRTEVRAGLEPGDVVVAYPSDRVADGVKVEPRAP